MRSCYQLVLRQKHALQEKIAAAGWRARAERQNIKIPCGGRYGAGGASSALRDSVEAHHDLAVPTLSGAAMNLRWSIFC